MGPREEQMQKLEGKVEDEVAEKEGGEDVVEKGAAGEEEEEAKHNPVERKHCRSEKRQRRIGVNAYSTIIPPGLLGQYGPNYFNDLDVS